MVMDNQTTICATISLDIAGGSSILRKRLHGVNALQSQSKKRENFAGAGRRRKRNLNSSIASYLPSCAGAVCAGTLRSLRCGMV